MTTTAERPFRVVTHRNWIADLFAPLGAEHDFGMDIDPDTARETLWWAPGHWVARAAAAGIHLPLLSAGQRWMAYIGSFDAGRKALQRDVYVVAAHQVPVLMEQLGLSRAHIKLPEVKDDRFPAEVRESFANDAVNPLALVQVSPVVPISDEARLFVAHGKVTASSWYRYQGVWSDEPAWIPGAGAAELAGLNSTVEALLRPLDAPPGFVVDIGISDGTPILLEANASWSSNPYDCDPQGVYESLVAAHDFAGEHRQWLFDTAQYGPVRPLQHSRSLRTSR